jgi:thiol:disulfide interchange protein DsbA
MLKNIFFIFIFLFSFATLLQAEGKGYEVLSPAQPVTNPDKIEVLEFFWYGCPHCYHLEPALNDWLATKPENVDYIRQPAAFNQQWTDHAKAFFVAKTLNIVDKVHADFFDAIQNKKQKLQSEADLADFFVAHGVAKEKFLETFNSFAVDAKVRQAKVITVRYGVQGVPALVVNGKYKITAKSAGGQKNMTKVLEAIIAQETKVAK